MLPMTVLLPVYVKIDAGHFRAAVDSVFGQTAPAREFVIVCDGPLTAELDEVVEEAQSRGARIVRLERNGGTAVASQAGVDVATQPWIVRQDADDVSVPHRLETMWKALEGGRYGAVGAAMYEFEGDPENVVGIRAMPESAAAVRAHAKFNNPVNNPTAIYSREAILEAGGYRHMPLMEDYDLVARILGRGHEIVNLPEPLVYFRTDGMFVRRRSRDAARTERRMQRSLIENGLVSRPRALVNLALRSAVRALPAGVYSALYRRVFRKGRAEGR